LVCPARVLAGVILCYLVDEQTIGQDAELGVVGRCTWNGVEKGRYIVGFLSSKYPWRVGVLGMQNAHYLRGLLPPALMGCPLKCQVTFGWGSPFTSHRMVAFSPSLTVITVAFSVNVIFSGRVRENNAILMTDPWPTAIPALTVHNQIEGFTMQTSISSFAGPIALVGQCDVGENDFQLFCARKINNRTRRRVKKKWKMGN